MYPIKNSHSSIVSLLFKKHDNYGFEILTLRSKNFNVIEQTKIMLNRKIADLTKIDFTKKKNQSSI